MPTPKRLNPDKVIEALEGVCEKFKVTLGCNPFTRDVLLYDKDGMEICSFKKLSGHDGPADLEIGKEYEASYSTEVR